MRKLILLAALFIGPATAHEAAPGWNYDHECCSDSDCAPVIATSVSPYSTAFGLLPPVLAPMTVTTIYGTAEVPHSLKRRESKDGRMHACIVFGRVICLYVPPSS